MLAYHPNVHNKGNERAAIQAETPDFGHQAFIFRIPFLLLFAALPAISPAQAAA
jgi:hypothetical protein